MSMNDDDCNVDADDDDFDDDDDDYDEEDVDDDDADDYDAIFCKISARFLIMMTTGKNDNDDV